MPGTVLLEARYCQEIAPKSKDRAERVRDDVTIETSAGTFENCLVVEEVSAIEDEREYSVYAPGAGVIQDEDLVLTSYRSAE